MLRKVLSFLLMAVLLFSFGCQKKKPEPGVSPMQPTQGHTGKGGMAKDPRAIKEVEGDVDDIGPGVLILSKGTMKLKFTLAVDTKVIPEGTSLTRGQHVKITIEHMPVGMKAKVVEVVKGKD